MKNQVLKLIETIRLEMAELGAWHESIMAEFAERAVKNGADPVATFWQLKQRCGMGY